MNVSTTTPLPAETGPAGAPASPEASTPAATTAGAKAPATSDAHLRDQGPTAGPAEPAASGPTALPRDTLSDDVRSSLLLIAATAAFALAVVALGALAAGVPV